MLTSVFADAAPILAANALAFVACFILWRGGKVERVEGEFPFSLLMILCAICLFVFYGMFLSGFFVHTRVGHFLPLSPAHPTILQLLIQQMTPAFYADFVLALLVYVTIEILRIVRGDQQFRFGSIYYLVFPWLLVGALLYFWFSANFAPSLPSAAQQQPSATSTPAGSAP